MSSADKPQNNRELLLLIHSGLYGDESHKGFFKEIRDELLHVKSDIVEIKNYIRHDEEEQLRRKETCPHVNEIEEIARAVRLRKDITNRKRSMRETLKVWMPLFVAIVSGPGLLLVLYIIMPDNAKQLIKELLQATGG